MRKKLINTDRETALKLIKASSEREGILDDHGIAHLVINGSEVVGARELPGLNVSAAPAEDGIEVRVRLEEGARIEKPVHMCFGVLPEKGVQKIQLDVALERNSSIDILAHCTFPFATDVKHIMNAQIKIGEGASYRYTERHIHSSTGGVKVYPKARVLLGDNAVFRTDFELLKGRVGLIDIDYETECGRGSTMEMTARVDGKEDDVVRISEKGFLKGEGSTGVLTTRIALRGRARGEVYNELIADAPHARGHVDCKEIVQGESSAKAVPVVQVNHPKAHITHEAAIGSVDSKQLQTLMSRGMNEEQATDLIIKGLLG